MAWRQPESEGIKHQKTKSQLILIDSLHTEGIKEISLHVRRNKVSLFERWEKIQQKYVSFIFLALIYMCIQFESTSQQAVMQLSDMLTYM